jgi:hypothetical protein
VLFNSRNQFLSLLLERRPFGSRHIRCPITELARNEPVTFDVWCNSNRGREDQLPINLVRKHECRSLGDAIICT